MTTDKLLEFYNKIVHKGIDVSVIRQLRNCSDKEIDTVINSKYPQIMMNLITNYEFKLFNQTKQKEIINIINNAKSEKIAFGIYNVAVSSIILSSGLTIQIAKIINESNIESSLSVIDIATTNRFLINSNSLDIMKIISSSKTEYQAKMAADVAKSIDVLLNKYVLDIIHVVCNTEGESRSKLANAIAKNRDVLSSGLTVKLINLVNKLDSEKIELITEIASDKILEKNKRSVYYITKMLESKSQIISIYASAKTEIYLLKKQESESKKEPDIFWNIYKNNPSEAIKLLKESDKSEVTIYTRVRKK